MRYDTKTGDTIPINETRIPINEIRYRNRRYDTDKRDTDTDKRTIELIRFRYWVLYLILRNVDFFRSLSALDTSHRIHGEDKITLSARYSPGAYRASTPAVGTVSSVTQQINTFRYGTHHGCAYTRKKKKKRGRGHNRHGTMVNRTYGTHKKHYIYLFLPTIFGPIYYGPP